MQQVRTPWFLALDADYFVPAAFAAELRDARAGADVRGYRASFRYAVGGKPLRASLYPPRIVLAATRARDVLAGRPHPAHQRRRRRRRSRANRSSTTTARTSARFVARQKRYMRRRSGEAARCATRGRSAWPAASAN